MMIICGDCSQQVTTTLLTHIAEEHPWWYRRFKAHEIKQLQTIGARTGEAATSQKMASRRTQTPRS